MFSWHKNNKFVYLKLKNLLGYFSRLLTLFQCKFSLLGIKAALQRFHLIFKVSYILKTSEWSLLFDFLLILISVRHNFSIVILCVCFFYLPFSQCVGKIKLLQARRVVELGTLCACCVLLVVVDIKSFERSLAHYSVLFIQQQKYL